jgi:hypothetical protein
MRRTHAPLLATLILGCAAPGDAREATLRSVFARADEPVARARPALLAGRYAKMAASPVSYYRGQVAVFLSDWRDPSVGLSRSTFAGDPRCPSASATRTWRTSAPSWAAPTR